MGCCLGLAFTAALMHLSLALGAFVATTAVVMALTTPYDTPAKRLARLNIELNSALVGVRILFEIIDAFGQRSLLQFKQFAAGVTIAPEAFTFTPPPGADVIEQ